MYHLYQIQDTPQPFKMLSAHPKDVAMEWLSTKEHGGPVTLPPLTLFVDDLDGDEGLVYLTSSALRERDRERKRCGLPPYWVGLATHLELNSGFYIQRLVKKLEAA